MRSILDNQAFEVSLDKIARTVSADGTAIDTGTDHFQRMLLFDFGAWTDGTHKWTIQSRQLSTDSWVALTAEELDDPEGALDTVDLNSINVIDATKDDSLFELGALTPDRFIRAVVTVSGGPSTGQVAGATAISAGKRYAGGQGQPMDQAGIARNLPSPLS
jgi:hypothetical protein